MDIALWIELGLFVILIAFSGFFSSSETSLFSLGKLQIEQMRRDDNPRVDFIERLLSEPRRLIVTILIGNEFVNVAASVISAAIVIRLFGAENKLINLAIMVPILLLFGEITPKTLAIRNNITFATFQCRPIQTFAVFIKPLRWLVRLFADWLTTLIVGKERAPGSIVTEDMVRVLAHEAVGEGVLDRNEAQYVDRVFDFGHKTVGDLKTPRSHIFYLSAQMPFRQMVAELRSSRHTRVPVFDGHRDNVLGFLYARDLVGVDVGSLEAKTNAAMEYLRPPYLVAETKLASALFHTFRRRKLSVALTVDEYGGVTGLVTMEDLLECIFGELPSPSDEAEKPEHLKLEDGSTRIPASMTIAEFNRLFESNLSDDGAETVGGVLLRTYGELPAEGVQLTLDKFTFEVIEVAATRIESMLVRRVEPAEGLEERTDAPSSAVGVHNTQESQSPEDSSKPDSEKGES